VELFKQVCKFASTIVLLGIVAAGIVALKIAIWMPHFNHRCNSAAGRQPAALERRRRVMGQLEPPSSRSQLFLIGKDSRGNWVVQDQEHLRGGLFIDRAEALRFAMFENGHRPQAVVMVPGVFELDLSGKPSVVSQPAAQVEVLQAAGQIEVPRARRILEGLLSFPANPAVVPV
jgi:hypothetical protein